ncbi:Penicillin-binding protein 1A [Nitrospira japonica]|uniref:Penicillin-binding protein 1A n=1 Tax=Nitrospira japonica TaxID=1325564 RepID=A0A1W1I1K7_9BACT|nr:Penicillin-binding protein 1A [Nitrospira japonica]
MSTIDRPVQLSDTPRRPPPRRPWRWWQIALLSALGLGLAGVLAVAGLLWQYSQDLPDLNQLQNYQPSLVTQVYSSDRQLIGQFFIERRILTPLSAIPEHLRRAVIAVEDVRFFEHPGLDYIGILRAAWTNVRRGGKVEGASTITQQLARSLFLSSERTFDRKVRELVVAYKMELVSSKEQILELYLNQIYFGQGAYGVASAAQSYFGKDLSALTVAEAAFLAGLPKSPNHFSPFKNFERAKKRQEHVLFRMEEAGFLTSAERERSAAEQLNFRRPGSEQIAPYFVEYVRQMLIAKYGEAMVYKGGLKVMTTLNLEMQQAAEAAFAAGLREIDKRQGWRGPVRTVDVSSAPPAAAVGALSQPLKAGDYLEAVVVKPGKDFYFVQIGDTQARLAFDDMAWAKRRLTGPDVTKDFVVNPNPKQILKPGDVVEVAVKKIEKDAVLVQLEQTPLVEGALVAMEPGKGAIRAMVGGFDFNRSEYNRAVQAHRQPGSAFKPLIYAAALDQGMSPASVVLDAPVVYEQVEEEKTWKPENYGKRFHGMVSLRDALAQSHNLATVRLLEKVGVKNVIEFSKQVGISSPLAADLSLALGSSSVGLMELTSAYGVFLNQGNRAEPYAIFFVKDNQEKVLELAEPESQEVISKETSYLITNMMEDVVQKGTGQAAKVLGRPVAGKTGTTNDFINAWFIGGTPNLVTGVFVGFDDRRSLGETESGAHAALPIWINFMKTALKQVPVVPFVIPEGITFVKVDPSTGLLNNDPEDQPGNVEIFTKGSEPTQAAQRRLDPTDFYKLDQMAEGSQ